MNSLSQVFLHEAIKSIRNKSCHCVSMEYDIVTDLSLKHCKSHHIHCHLLARWCMCHTIPSIQLHVVSCLSLLDSGKMLRQSVKDEAGE